MSENEKLIGPKRVGEITRSEFRQLMERNKINLQKTNTQVAKILAEVRSEGDRALVRLERKFDGANLSTKGLRVSSNEMQNANRAVSRDVKNEIRRVTARIVKVHNQQLPREGMLLDADGVRVREIHRALPSVGIYIPGGTAAYPSTALMLSAPARVAGVERIVACSPPSSDGTVNPLVLVALDIVGVNEIYKVGGAQAIAAMAYGTRTIPSVGKIIGPGNIYVTTAKWMVSDEVGIDFPAGPSEVLVIADDSAKPSLIAADLISQAEHDPYSVAVLISLSEKLAVSVKQAVNDAIQNVARQNVIRASFKRHGALLVSESRDAAVEFANQFAAEHVELVVN
ncbi:MAG: histidinol dehydrogenase, partial [Candidatus Bathyarchaeia archaeon]